METNNILFFDIETEGNPEVFDMMTEPTAPANYKDADKIAAYIAEKKAEQQSMAALDSDYGRIITIGMQLGIYGTPITTLINEVGEKEALEAFWFYFNRAGGVSCGYNIIGFDLPYILRRSFALGVKPSIIPKLAKYQTYPTIDLMGILYNWGQAKGLKWVCKRYGIENPLPDLDGSKVKDMDQETLIKYSINDVKLIVDLYKKMAGIYF
jgi:DNA polymerase elongation subunit (family B)